jgi:YD repeat-containing protein
LLFALILIFTACTGGESQAKQEQQVTQISQKNNLEPHYKLTKEEKEKVYLQVTAIREDVDSGESYVTRIEKYDKEDRLLSVIDKNEKGEVTHYEKYKYDSDGNLLEETRSRLMLGGNIMGITKFYSYDEQGRKTGYIAKNEWGNKCGKGIYKYYEDGNLKYKYTNDQYRGREKKYYYNKEEEKTKVIDDVDGTFDLHAVSHFEREYDEQGRKIKETEIRKIDGEFGKKTAEITTYYNMFGKSKKYIEKVNGKIDTWFEREYNKNGNEIKFVSKYSDGTIRRIRKSKYDKNNNKIEDLRKARDDNGQFWIFLWVEHKYNENRDIIKSTEKDENGNYLVNTYYRYKIIKR